MSIKQTRETVKDMLKELSTEVTNQGGFPEYPQFCEESLVKLIEIMSAKQLEWLMGEIEDTSYLGIRRSNY